MKRDKKKLQIDKGEKVQIGKGNQSPNKKENKSPIEKENKLTVQIKIEKSKLELKKKSFLRPRCKTAEILNKN